ncbi:DUF3037 domain-containing protein [Sphingobacterium multivorum]|uniref:DUF3037 domain-containing protein n=1 Tax=Sphingobacterium multivorum TaxID=28454 RepID=A0ABX7CVB6_SPHMU|nr:DUF3037 domain-containing protein [Sphingobacterium multivorum]QQT28619.1 DUF3037 domain-containing protein [Sphingobacterium multivorum]QQT55313.1 DUF3037 domain-containing protein [Sphingobacterium multivorum]
MKKFQYQVLQFCPDKVTGEFLNVGIVVFDPTNQNLAYRILHKVGSIGQLFEQANTRYLIKQLNTIHTSLNKIKNAIERDKLGMNVFKSVDELTRKAFVRDDSALLFSDIRHSLDISIDHLVDYLGERMLTVGKIEIDQDIKSDKEVWTKMFKRYFDDRDISPLLSPRTVKTKYDEISFEHTWKNGHINFFESVNFDLQKEDTIKNKVRRWAGQIEELKTVGEELHLYILANMPDANDQMSEYISSFLSDKSSKDVRVDIVTLNEADSFVNDLKEEIVNHPS